MSNYESDMRRGELWAQAPRLCEEFPAVECVRLRTADGMRVINRGDKLWFAYACPHAECYSINSGVDFTDDVRRMIAAKETRRVISRACGGYGDEHRTYGCDWECEAEVSIDYRESQTD